MAAAYIYGSGRWLRGISDLVSLVHFGRSGGRNHNAACFVTIPWKERTLNDGSGHYPNDGYSHYSVSMAAAITLTMGAAIIYDSDHYPNDGSGLYLWQRPLASRNF